MLPSVSGYYGLWEAEGVFAMAIFGETSDIAAGFSLLSHVMLMFPVLFVDFLSAVVTVGSI